jgi:hypothetical protein
MRSPIVEVVDVDTRQGAMPSHPALAKKCALPPPASPDRVPTPLVIRHRRRNAAFVIVNVLVALVDVVMTNIVIVVNPDGCQRGRRTMRTTTICRSCSHCLGSGGQTQCNMKAAVRSTRVQ